jgi:hypothetical protein
MQAREQARTRERESSASKNMKTRNTRFLEKKHKKKEEEKGVETKKRVDSKKKEPATMPLTW